MDQRFTGEIEFSRVVNEPDREKLVDAIIAVATMEHDELKRDLLRELLGMLAANNHPPRMK